MVGDRLTVLSYLNWDYKMASYPVFNLVITSNINSFETIRRFPKDITITELRNKLELLTGASSATMELHLLDKSKLFLMKLDDGGKNLESYPIENDMYIHVYDSSHKVGEFEDLSAVQKFEISEDSYNKRSQTFRAFKEKLSIGDTGDQKNKADPEKKLKEEEELIKTFKIGDKCQVSLSGQPNKTGTIQYLGKTEFKPGFWVGVAYDQPLGKNNGSVGGVKYFSCEPKHGGFVKPHDVHLSIEDNRPEEL